ncbi:MAG: YdeI/OmpD-associated family protein [Candidatus Wallbacteria bacterium]|nr:YdeI/OmpD-associated family protein [Candidatus Wallbacteria bacterium]
MTIYEFDAVILKHDEIDAAFIEFPYDVEKEFGTKGQVKILATFDGCAYRGSLAKMGHACHCLGLTKVIRSRIGKQPGETIHVVITRDDQPREIEIPDVFMERLSSSPEARKLFDSLSFTNRKAYVQWIICAKKEETRSRRTDDSIRLLLKGIKSPR